ncbi:DUF2617 family protein [Nocardiopsis sediminis]|uniref:DUF2617 family protein n=1 Tax=Nocardiopsis sediminis TaxID=1778267 RepID=A0ABV8FVV5_9ACTN
MLQTITQPFVDTRAADLSWTIGHPPIAPLAARTVDPLVGGPRVELRILGASHQVLVEAAGPGWLTETVACLPGTDGGLPAQASPAVHGVRHYDFASSVRRLAPKAFAAQAQKTARAVAAHPCGLLATFPGSPDAITGLVVRADGHALLWRSWHAYPQTGELVTTTTSLDPRGTRSAPTPETETSGDDL